MTDNKKLKRFPRMMSHEEIKALEDWFGSLEIQELADLKRLYEGGGVNMIRLKVIWHCFYKTFTDSGNDHRHVVHLYLYPSRRFDFCTCGYMRPPGENNQDTSGL